MGSSPLGRASEADVRVSFGLMSMTVNLYTGARTDGKKAVAMKMCCPTCYEDDKSAHLLNIRYHCTHDEAHGPFQTADVVKGSEDDEGNVSIVGTAAEVKETKAASVGLAKKEMELTFLYADEVLPHFFPSDKNYVITSKDDLYAVLLELIEDDGFIHGAADGRPRIGIGTIRMRDNEHVVWVRRWGDQMVFTMLIRPEDKKMFPEPVIRPVSDKNLSMARALIEATTEDFDAENFTDQVRRGVLLWKSARMSGVTVDVPSRQSAAPKDPDADLQAMLEAAVEAARAKKVS